MSQSVKLQREFLAPCFTGAADASWADQNDSLEPIKMKSTLGWDLFYRNCLIGYGSKTSSRICGSSTEAECMALVEFGKLNSYCRNYILEIGWSAELPATVVVEDNVSAVNLSKEGAKAKRSRHFEISWYKFKEECQQGRIVVKSVSTCDQHADIFTKPLGTEKFRKHQTALGLALMEDCKSDVQFEEEC